MNEKLKSYFGFARRAGKLTLGVAAVEGERRKVYLLVADTDASPNTKQEIAKIRTKFSCPFLETGGLGELTNKTEVKLVAVREEHLAAAILAELSNRSPEE